MKTSMLATFFAVALALPVASFGDDVKREFSANGTPASEFEGKDVVVRVPIGKDGVSTGAPEARLVNGADIAQGDDLSRVFSQGFEAPAEARLQPNQTQREFSTCYNCCNYYVWYPPVYFYNTYYYAYNYYYQWTNTFYVYTYYRYNRYYF